MGTLVGMVGRLTYWRFGKLLLLGVDETVRGQVIGLTLRSIRRDAHFIAGMSNTGLAGRMRPASYLCSLRSSHWSSMCAIWPGTLIKVFKYTLPGEYCEQLGGHSPPQKKNCICWMNCEVSVIKDAMLCYSARYCVRFCLYVSNVCRHSIGIPEVLLSLAGDVQHTSA